MAIQPILNGRAVIFFVAIVDPRVELPITWATAGLMDYARLTSQDPPTIAAVRPATVSPERGWVLGRQTGAPASAARG